MIAAHPEPPIPQQGVGGDLQELRGGNRVAVLRTLRRKPVGLSIRSISDAVGLSRPTVKLVLGELSDRGLVVDSIPQDPSTRGGRPSRRFALADTAGLVVAAAIGIEATDIAIATIHGEIVSRAQLPPQADVLRRAQITSAVRSLLALAGKDADAVVGATIGVIGSVTPEQRVLPNPTILELSAAGYFPALAEDLGCEVRVCNDADLAALGEFGQLAGTGVLDMIGLHANVAMGAGLIIGGRLHAGHSGMAAELGVIDLFGWHTSHLPLLAAARDRDIPVSDVFRGASAGAPWAVALVERFIQDSAPGILAMILTVNPECVVLGGDICRADSVARNALERALSPLGDRAPQVLLSSLGSDCIVFGAVGLATESRWAQIEAELLEERTR
ncbi:MAG: ROK family transcriptional regulator [Actinobacteria bacterium]|nr:ROK family transcriptional regulator [Actinomycetota bacterium]